MKASKLLITSLSAFSFIAVNTMPQAAKAAVSCEAGTADNYPNGSLESCRLSIEANIGLSNNYFPCKASNRISFDEKGQFNSCTLAREIQLRSGNELTTCPADAQVYVEIQESGNQSIRCY